MTRKCKIVFIDEVKAQIKGLDHRTTGKCIDKLKFLVPYRFHIASYRLGRWDGSIRFFDKNGKTYINLLEDIVPLIAQEGYDFEFEDHRENPSIEVPKISNDIFADHVWPEGHFMEGQPIMLRDDQVEAANYFADNRYGVQVLATGFGKCMAGDTLIDVEPLGRLKIEKFYEMASSVGEQTDENEYKVTDSLKMYVPSPKGRVQVLGVTKKRSKLYTFTIDGGITVRVSPEHKFFYNNLPVKAETIVKYGLIDTKFGIRRIERMSVSEEEHDVYDISVEYPNAYYDGQGILHHNTLLTAAVCKVVEPLGRSLTIVPSQSLVEQTADDFRLVGMDVGVYYSDEKDPGRDHTITTWQSLNEIIESKDAETFHAMTNNVVEVIVDECFSGETLVWTDKGNIPIKDIREGDTVINYCTKTGKYKTDTVVSVFENMLKSSSENMLKLEISQGDDIEVTANHKFLTDEGWVRADNLKEGSNLVGVSHLSDYITVKNISVIPKHDSVYNLHVENDHNYVAGGVVVSNCHQAKSKSLDTILGKYLPHVPLRRGFTGTMPKEIFDAKSIIANVGPVVNRVTAKQLQDKGILSKCHVHCVVTKDKKEYTSYDQEAKSLNTDKDRLDFISDFINEVNKTGNTLVLVNKVAAGELLNDMIPDSTFVYGKTKVKERKSTYQSVQTSDNKVIIATYQVAAVGINIPRIFNLVMIEAGKSFVRVIQTIGRGIRVAKDKDFVNIWDISSESKFSKKHLKARIEYYDESEYPYDKFTGTYRDIIEAVTDYDDDIVEE